VKILHIFRSKPDDMVNLFIKEISKGKEFITVSLYKDRINYDQLLMDIFNCDRIVSWW
jgi:hypothetical protein